MRDLIISTICMLIIIIPWGFYDKFAADTVENYKSIIKEEILPAIEDDDWDTAEKRFAFIAKDWDRYKKTSAFFIDTQSVNEVDCYVSRAYYYIKLRDNTRLLIDYEELAKENSLKGMYTARMLDNIRMQEQAGNEKGAALYRKALELGIRAFEGEVGVDEN